MDVSLTLVLDTGEVFELTADANASLRAVLRAVLSTGGSPGSGELVCIYNGAVVNAVTPLSEMLSSQLKDDTTGMTTDQPCMCAAKIFVFGIGSPLPLCSNCTAPPCPHALSRVEARLLRACGSTSNPTAAAAANGDGDGNAPYDSTEDDSCSGSDQDTAAASSEYPKASDFGDLAGSLAPSIASDRRRPALLGGVSANAPPKGARNRSSWRGPGASSPVPGLESFVDKRQGWLWKLGSGKGVFGSESWAKRWVDATSSALTYHRAPGEPVLGTIPYTSVVQVLSQVDRYTHARAEDEGSSYFGLVVPDDDKGKGTRILLLRAADDLSRDGWVGFFGQFIVSTEKGNANDKNTYNPPPPPPSLSYAPWFSDSWDFLGLGNNSSVQSYLDEDDSVVFSGLVGHVEGGAVLKKVAIVTSRAFLLTSMDGAIEKTIPGTDFQDITVFWEAPGFVRLDYTGERGSTRDRPAQLMLQAVYSPVLVDAVRSCTGHCNNLEPGIPQLPLHIVDSLPSGLFDVLTGVSLKKLQRDLLDRTAALTFRDSLSPIPLMTSECAKILAGADPVLAKMPRQQLAVALLRFSQLPSDPALEACKAILELHAPDDIIECSQPAISVATVRGLLSGFSAGLFWDELRCQAAAERDAEALSKGR